MLFRSLANAIGCKTESMPFTYLGLPMGTTKPKIDDFIGIIERIDRRLIGIADTLSYDGRLIVVKSIISSIPNFAFCTIKMPIGFVEHVEKSSRGFLWAGKEIEKRGNCLVKWDKVCKPKKAGGLGVLDLRTQNNALMMKFSTNS